MIKAIADEYKILSSKKFMNTMEHIIKTCVKVILSKFREKPKPFLFFIKHIRRLSLKAWTCINDDGNFGIG